MKTYYGIFLDLEESTYIADINNFKFYFSSEAILKKFLANIEKYEKEGTFRFRSSYNIEIEDSTIFFAISYYSIIEKRGFKIEYWENGKLSKTWNEKPKFIINIHE